jgi:uncharacterized protein (TIGR03118 family)
MTRINLRNRILPACALLATFAGPLSANAYLVHNLVADQAGVADHTDKNLVNPWGNAYSATSPFWVGDNGTGLSTLYDGTGTPNSSIVVAIPAAGGASTPGPVTGVMQNSVTTAFQVASGKQSQFAFCSLDGVISGWNNSVNSTHALVLLDNSSKSAVYPGCAVATPTGGTPQMYLVNFNSGKVEVYDQNMNPITAAFTNSAIPAGYAPYNIAILGGKVYVAYAKQDPAKKVSVAGAGNGFVAVYDLSGNLLGPTISGGNLNAPWGMTIAPATFGDFSNDLLIGNFGDGKINAYNATTGAYAGTLEDLNGSPIVLPGLWWIGFGNNGSHFDPATLYFVSGPGGQQHGLLGSIQSAPTFTSANLLNGASFSTTLAPNAWVSIKGGELSATTRSWAASDFSGNTMPTILNGVSVQVNGNGVPVSYISPTQINFLMPATISPGTVTIATANNGLNSTAVSATVAAAAPAFFTLGAVDATTGNSYIAAEHADGSIAGPPNLISGVTVTPYNAGETMVLYGTGFGATTSLPPNGQLLTAAIPLAAMPTATVGGQPATVSYAGLVGPGLYQLNIVLPAGTTAGQSGTTIEVPVVVTASGVQTQAKAVVGVTPGQ